MRIIYFLLLVSLFCLVSAKYLPDEGTGSRALLRKQRSISDETKETIENNSDDENDEDNDGDGDGDDEDDEGDSSERKLIEQQNKQQEKREKEERKRLEKERKLQEKLEEQQRKLQEKLEKEERKLQEKLEKEERKRQEQEQKRQEKLAKEERKRQEKEKKRLEEIEKKALKETKPIVEISSESAEDNESLDLEDIWQNYVYSKYALPANSSDLEKDAAINKYLREELGLDANSTKTEYRQAVLQLVQNRLLNETVSQDGFRTYVKSHVNAVYIKKLSTEIENKIAELDNDTALLQNVSLPWAVEAQQAIEQKKTILSTIVQFLSNVVPSWLTGGQTSTATNVGVVNNDDGSSSVSVTNRPGPGSSSNVAITSELVTGSLGVDGSVSSDVSGSDSVVSVSTSELSSTGVQSPDVASNGVPDNGSSATASVSETSLILNSNSLAGQIDAIISGSKPSSSPVSSSTGTETTISIISPTSGTEESILSSTNTAANSDSEISSTGLSNVGVQSSTSTSSSAAGVQSTTLSNQGSIDVGVSASVSTDVKTSDVAGSIDAQSGAIPVDSSASVNSSSVVTSSDVANASVLVSSDSASAVSNNPISIQPAAANLSPLVPSVDPIITDASTSVVSQTVPKPVDGSDVLANVASTGITAIESELSVTNETPAGVVPSVSVSAGTSDNIATPQDVASSQTISSDVSGTVATADSASEPAVINSSDATVSVAVQTVEPTISASVDAIVAGPISLDIVPTGIEYTVDVASEVPSTVAQISVGYGTSAVNADANVSVTVVPTIAASVDLPTVAENVGVATEVVSTESATQTINAAVNVSVPALAPNTVSEPVPLDVASTAAENLVVVSPDVVSTVVPISVGHETSAVNADASVSVTVEPTISASVNAIAAGPISLDIVPTVADNTVAVASEVLSQTSEGSAPAVNTDANVSVTAVPNITASVDVPIFAEVVNEVVSTESATQTINAAVNVSVPALAPNTISEPVPLDVASTAAENLVVVSPDVVSTVVPISVGYETSAVNAGASVSVTVEPTISASVDAIAAGPISLDIVPTVADNTVAVASEVLSQTSEGSAPAVNTDANVSVTAVQTIAASVDLPTVAENVGVATEVVSTESATQTINAAVNVSVPDLAPNTVSEPVPLDVASTAAENLVVVSPDVVSTVVPISVGYETSAVNADASVSVTVEPTISASVDAIVAGPISLDIVPTVADNTVAVASEVLSQTSEGSAPAVNTDANVSVTAVSTIAASVDLPTVAENVGVATEVVSTESATQTINAAVNVSVPALAPNTVSEPVPLDVASTAAENLVAVSPDVVSTVVPISVGYETSAVNADASVSVTVEPTISASVDAIAAGPISLDIVPTVADNTVAVASEVLSQTSEGSAPAVNTDANVSVTAVPTIAASVDLPTVAENVGVATEVVSTESATQTINAAVNVSVPALAPNTVSEPVPLDVASTAAENLVGVFPDPISVGSDSLGVIVDASVSVPSALPVTASVDVIASEPILLDIVPTGSNNSVVVAPDVVSSIAIPSVGSDSQTITSVASVSAATSTESSALVTSQSEVVSVNVSAAELVPVELVSTVSNISVIVPSEVVTAVTASSSIAEPTNAAPIGTNAPETVPLDNSSVNASLTADVVVSVATPSAAIIVDTNASVITPSDVPSPSEVFTDAVDSAFGLIPDSVLADSIASVGVSVNVPSNDSSVVVAISSNVTSVDGPATAEVPSSDAGIPATEPIANSVSSAPNSTLENDTNATGSGPLVTDSVNVVSTTLENNSTTGVPQPILENTNTPAEPSTNVATEAETGASLLEVTTQV